MNQKLRGVIGGCSIAMLISALAPHANTDPPTSASFVMETHEITLGGGLHTSESYVAAACVTAQPAGLSTSSSYIMLSGCFTAAAGFGEEVIPPMEPVDEVEPVDDVGPPDMGPDIEDAGVDVETPDIGGPEVVQQEVETIQRPDFPTGMQLGGGGGCFCAVGQSNTNWWWVGVLGLVVALRRYRRRG